MSSHKSTQHGAVLIIVLVMVGIFMIIVTSLVGSSNINFRIAGNQQYRMEAKIAARHGLETYLSNDANFELPLPNADVPVGIDFDGDNVDDLVAVLPPAVCTKAETIKVSELNPTVQADAQCLGSGAGQQSGIIGGTGSGSTAGNSWCSRMNWQVSAAVNDDATGASVNMFQGIFMRAVVGTPCPS